MSVPTSPVRFALICGLFVAPIVAANSYASETESQVSDGWTDSAVAEHAANLAGPKTVAVVHFQTADADAAPCIASWFDRFEKRIAGETLEEYGIREAVVAIDVGSFGTVSTRALFGVNADYSQDADAKTELQALFAPLGERLTFGEGTIHVAKDETHVARQDQATLDVRCVEKRLAAVGEAPLRLITVEPRSVEDAASFVSLPESRVAASGGACLVVAFDYRTSTGVLRIVADDEAAIELRIDDETGRAPAFRALARMARVTADRLFPPGSTDAAVAPEAAELAEIELPPFGLPLVQ